MKEKCISYVRVSTDMQDFENQQYHVNKYIDFLDFKNVKNFGDIVSGSVEAGERDEFSKLKLFLEENKDVKHLVVNELSRLGRKLSDILQIIENYNHKGICIHIRDHEIRTLDKDGNVNHTGQLLIMVLGMVAEMEREQIKQRTRDGKIKSVLVNKKWAGGTPPFGFDTDDKYQLIPHKERADIIVKIFEMYNKGYSTVKIANYLNNNNIKTRYNKSKWKEGTIREILINEIYKGKRSFIGEIIDCPQIVPNDLFKNVNERINNLPNQKDKKKYNYVFDNRIIKCGVCGENFSYVNRGNEKSCKCSTYRYNDRCENFGIGITKLYNAIYHYLHNSFTLSDNERKKEKKIIEEKIKSLIIDKNNLTNELNETKNKRTKIKDLYIDSIINRKELLERIDKIDNAETNNKFKLEIVNDKINELKSINLDIVYDFNKMSKERINLLVKEIVTLIKIYPVKNGAENLYNRKSDVVSLFEIFLKNRIEPVRIIITRFSNLYYGWAPEIDLATSLTNYGNNNLNSFNFKTFTLTVDDGIAEAVKGASNLGDYEEYWKYDNIKNPS